MSEYSYDFDKTEETEKKAQILKAILCVIPSLFTFYFSQLLLVIIISLVFGLLLLVPFMDKILGIFTAYLGHTGESLVIWISVLLSYLVTGWGQGLMMKNALTESLSRKITGSVIIGFNLLCLILNLIFQNPLTVNITCIFFGIFYTIYSKEN